MHVVTRGSRGCSSAGEDEGEVLVFYTMLSYKWYVRRVQCAVAEWMEGCRCRVGDGQGLSQRGQCDVGHGGQSMVHQPAVAATLRPHSATARRATQTAHAPPSGLPAPSPPPYIHMDCPLLVDSLTVAVPLSYPSRVTIEEMPFSLKAALIHSATSPASHQASPPSDPLPLLLAFLQSPLWLVPLNSFIDSHSLSFTPNTEHSLSHTALHQAYIALAESLLTSHLTALSIPPSSLPSLLSSALSSPLSPTARRTVEALLVLEDYVVFHTRMVARNMELDREVLERVMLDEGKKKAKGKEKERQNGEVRRGGEDEDEAMRMAIALSLMEEEREKREREEEKAELDYAIALSLALQAQDLPSSAPRPPLPSTHATAVDLPLIRAAEEEKEALTIASPTEAMAALQLTGKEPSAPSKRSSQRITATLPITLGPLKGVRRATPPTFSPPAQPLISHSPNAPFSSPLAPASSTSTATSAFTAEELKVKAEFLRQQRDLLIAQKQRKADEELKAFHRQVSEEELGQSEANQTSAANEKVQSGEEMQRVAMQRMLRERLKEEAERTIGKRQEQRRAAVDL